MSYRYEKTAEQHLSVTLRTGPEWMASCPFHQHDGTSTLQINVEKGLFLCFACSARGTIKSMVERLGRDFVEPAASVEILNAKLFRLQHPIKETEQEPLPESYLKRYDIPHPYWKERGFDPETIKTWNLGYDPISDRVTIPYRTSRGELAGIIYRRLDDGFPRYQYPKGFPRRTSLFGSWKIRNHADIGTVAIVEGSLDAIRCWQAEIPALAQYGSAISEEQVRLLRKLGVYNVTLFYDDDKAGYKAVWKALERLDGFRVNVVTYEDKGWPSDPGAMSLRQVRRAVRTALRAADAPIPVPEDDRPKKTAQRGVQRVSRPTTQNRKRHA